MKRISLLLVFLAFGLSLHAQVETEVENSPVAKDTTLIQFRSADELKSIKTDSTDLKKLIGNVLLEQGEMTFRCDSAYLFFEQNYMEAFGRVHVTQGDSVNIFGDYLKYLGDSKLAFLYDNVRMNDDKTRITADTLVYSVRTKRALLHKGIRVIDEENNISADSLEYYTSSKNANLYGDVKFRNGPMKIQADTMRYNTITKKGSFKGGGKVINNGLEIESERANYDSATKQVNFENDVHLIDPQYDFTSETLDYEEETGRAIFGANTVIKSDSSTITGNEGWYNKDQGTLSIWKDAGFERGSSKLTSDSLFFDNNTGLGKAYRNVVWRDTLNDFTLESEYSEYDQDQGDFLSTQQPLLKIALAEKDTLYLRADTLRSTQSTDSLISGIGAFSAYYNVAMYSTDFQGVCDSLEYSFTDSIFQFFEDPILWVEDTQLTADSIFLHTKNRKAEEIKLRRNGMIVSPETEEGIFNQLSGLNIDGKFTDNKLSSFDVFGEAKSIYFAKDDNERYIGVNQSASDNMTIWFADNKVSRIKFREEPKATYSPITKVDPYTIRLERFYWEEEARPRSVDQLLVVRMIKRKSSKSNPDVFVSKKGSDASGTYENKKTGGKKFGGKKKRK